MSGSLEYLMFRFADDYPTAESMSEMIMQVAMDDDRGDSENSQRLLRHLVNAAYELRYQEALEDSEDEDDVTVPVADDPACLFMSKYEAECERIGEPVSVGDAWWETWWPIHCNWHPRDIARLARLKAGEARSIRRQLREEFEKHKGGE